jgi:hypothetical protein
MSLFDRVKEMLGNQSAGDTGIVSHAVDLVNNPETGGLQGPGAAVSRKRHGRAC